MNNPWRMEQCMEEADRLIELARKRPESLLSSGSFSSKCKSIHQKLLDLYVEQSKKKTHCKRLLCTTHLLRKLVLRDHLNTLVVNLYPGNDGYSLMIKGRNGNDSETIRLPYEEKELLDYIDAGQLPPLIVDLLDKLHLNIFYSGCIIVELRDYRRTTDSSFDTNYALLRPTPHTALSSKSVTSFTQTLICDVNAMTNDGRKWTQEDKFRLESELLLATSEPLCLDPSPTVMLIANKIQHEKRIFNSTMMKKSVKRFSQAAVNRRRKMAPFPAPKHLRLHDFVSQHKDKGKSSQPVRAKMGKTCIDVWRQRPVELTMPESIPVEKYSKVIEKTKLTNDNTPVVLEKFTLETDPNHGKVNYSQLTILQRLSDEFYMGELYVDRHFVEGKSHGSTCRFPLGSKSNVDKYISQFREIFTEEGRRQVKITHQVVGQMPSVTYTHSVHPTGHVTQLCVPSAAGGAGGDAHRAAPIKLSLSLNPQVSTPQSVVQIQGDQPSGTAQLTLNLQPVTSSSNKSRRQLTVYASLPTNRLDSPNTATAPPSSQLPTYAQATAGLGLPQGGTPPPHQAGIITPTGQEHAGFDLPDNNTFIQVDSSDPNTSMGTLMLAPPVASANPPGGATAAAVAVSSSMGIPQGLAGLQNLGLANLQTLQGLHNIQVSLDGTIPAGITMPLSVVSPTTPTSAVIVSSRPLGGASSALTAQQGRIPAVSSPTSYVTMVTASNVVLGSSSAGPITGVVSSPQVLTSPTGLSLPIGIAGNLTQIMAAAGLKTAQGIRPGAPLFLSQIPAQQSLQLLSTRGSQQSRATLNPGLVQTADGKQGLTAGTALLAVPPGINSLHHQPQQQHLNHPLTTHQLLLAQQQQQQLRAAVPVMNPAQQQLLQLTPQQQQQLAVQLATQQLQQLGKMTAIPQHQQNVAMVQQTKGKGRKRSLSSTLTKPP